MKGQKKKGSGLNILVGVLLIGLLVFGIVTGDVTVHDSEGNQVVLFEGKKEVEK